MDMVQPRATAGYFFLEFETAAQIRQLGQFGIPLTGRGLEAVPPGANVRRERRKFRALFKVGAKTGGEYHKIGFDPGIRRVQPQAAPRIFLHRDDGTVQQEPRPSRAGNPDRTGAGRRYLLSIEVVANTPFPGIRQTPIAMNHARMTGALAFVDTRQFGTPDQQVNPCGARFQRGCCTVHRRGPAPDDCHTLAFEPVVLQTIP